MAKWPVSRWGQGAIALAIAHAVAICVCIWTNNAYFEEGVKESPYDGQLGLSAFWGAVHVGAVVFAFCRVIFPLPAQNSA
jgi:hypothetical protein